MAILEQPCDKGASVEERVETALGAALDLLAAEPAVARLLFVEAPGASEEISLTGGLASHLSGRVLAGEAEHLPDSYDLLLVYLLTPPLPATASVAGEQRA